MKRMFLYCLMCVALLVSCQENDSVYPVPQLESLGLVTPTISGNEITFEGLDTLGAAPGRIDELELRYTTPTNCDAEQWVYNFRTEIWVQITRPKTIDCGQVISQWLFPFEVMGFPPPAYIGTDGELRLRCITTEKLEEASTPWDYSLEVFAYDL